MIFGSQFENYCNKHAKILVKYKITSFCLTEVCFFQYLLLLLLGYEKDGVIIVWITCCGTDKYVDPANIYSDGNNIIIIIIIGVFRFKLVLRWLRWYFVGSYPFAKCWCKIKVVEKNEDVVRFLYQGFNGSMK